MKYIINKYSVMLYIVVLIVAMLFPWNGFGIVNPIGHGEMGDYVAHFLVFLPWAGGGYVLWGERVKMVRWLVIGTIFLTALEFCQYALPYRGFNVYDILIGEVGLLCSYIVYYLYRGSAIDVVKQS